MDFFVFFFFFFFLLFSTRGSYEITNWNNKTVAGCEIHVFFFLFFVFFHMTYGNADAFVRLDVDADRQRFANSDENQKASIIRWERQTVPMLLIWVWEAWSLAFFESGDLHLSARNCIQTGQRTAARSHSLSKSAFPKSRSREKCPLNCSVGGCELLGLFMFLRQRNTQRWRWRLHMIIFNN